MEAVVKCTTGAKPELAGWGKETPNFPGRCRDGAGVLEKAMGRDVDIDTLVVL